MLYRWYLRNLWDLYMQIFSRDEVFINIISSTFPFSLGSVKHFIIGAKRTKLRSLEYFYNRRCFVILSFLELLLTIEWTNQWCLLIICYLKHFLVFCLVISKLFWKEADIFMKEKIIN